MRSYIYQPICFFALLILCLMFAPFRLMTGDRQALPQSASTASDSFVAPSSELTFDELCRNDPIGALARSMQRYKQEVEGYSCIMMKQERIEGTLKKPEVVRCEFRESPFTVRMQWLEGRTRAHALLYPAEGRRDRLAVVPANEMARKLVPFVTRSLDDREVRTQSRYPITEFSMNSATARAHAAMVDARNRGTMKIRYDGIRPIPELDGKRCYVLHRDSDIPEEDGQTHLMLCFDAETLLQVGTVVHAGNELVATYFFKDVVVNPRFEPDYFTIERLK